MGVEGTPIPVVGVADVEVSFSGVNVQAEFIVAKALSADAILGLDFLEQNRCVINAEQRVLYLKGRALALSNTESTSKTMSVDAKAVLYESLCLPPLSEVEIMVKVKSESVSTDVCLVEAAPLKELPVIVANALVRPIESNKEITIPIRLINPSSDSVTLYKGSTVARVSGIDLYNVVANINPKPPDTHSDVSKAEQELLWDLVCGSGQGLDVQQQDKLYALLLSFATSSLDELTNCNTQLTQREAIQSASNLGGYHHLEEKKYTNSWMICYQGTLYSHQQAHGHLP